VKRMDKLGFPLTDPVYQRALVTRNAVDALRVFVEDDGLILMIRTQRRGGDGRGCRNSISTASTHAMSSCCQSLCGRLSDTGRRTADPYGKVTVRDEDWTVDTGGSDFEWEYLHQGGRLDGSTGLYDFRNRAYSATLGRWVQQDPMGYIDGASVYQAMLSNPTTKLDPTGLQHTGQDWDGYYIQSGSERIYITGGPRPPRPIDPGPGYNPKMPGPAPWENTCRSTIATIIGISVGIATGNPLALDVIIAQVTEDDIVSAAGQGGVVAFEHIILRAAVDAVVAKAARDRVGSPAARVGQGDDPHLRSRDENCRGGVAVLRGNVMLRRPVQQVADDRALVADDSIVARTAVHPVGAEVANHVVVAVVAGQQVVA
jgi:RHS repeat-associated protein